MALKSSLKLTAFGETGNTKGGRAKLPGAFMVPLQGHHFPGFHIDAVEGLLELKQGAMPAQFIGPALLTALHHRAFVPVKEKKKN